MREILTKINEEIKLNVQSGWEPFGELDEKIAECYMAGCDDAETITLCGISVTDLVRWQASRTLEERKKLISAKKFITASAKMRMLKRYRDGETTFDQDFAVLKQLAPEWRNKITVGTDQAEMEPISVEEQARLMAVFGRGKVLDAEIVEKKTGD